MAVVAGETRIHLEPPQADGDVSGVAEGGTHTTGGFTRRSARKFVLLDQDDIGDARLGEVERDAGADHAAANDHDRRALGKIRAHVHVHFLLRLSVVPLYADAPATRAVRTLGLEITLGRGFGLPTAVPTTPRRAVPNT